MYVQPAIVIENRRQFTIAAGAQSDPLEQGTYDVWGAADTYVKVAEVANDVTSDTGYFVPAKASIPIRIGRDGLRIGSTAELRYHRVE